MWLPSATANGLPRTRQAVARSVLEKCLVAAEVRRILVIQGHPDWSGGHYCHTLADENLRGARGNGHAVELIDIATSEVPFLRSREDLVSGVPPQGIRHAQAALLACDHVVIIHPLWNGAAPALGRAFMEQTLRPSFIFPDAAPDAQLSFASAFTQRKALKGKSARGPVAGRGATGSPDRDWLR